MADIYSNSNIILKSMMVVFNYLKKNNFTAGKDIEFEMALKRLMAFWSLNPSESALFVCIFITYFDLFFQYKQLAYYLNQFQHIKH
jgi:hypothetical protein